MSLNIELLEQSFERVKPQATQFASSFYQNLLTDYPQLRPLFSKTNMEAQEQKLVMSLVLVVENLRSPHYLKTILQNLGERHVGYGAKQEHYDMVGAALLKTFESHLGSDWTPNVKQAWTDAYGAIVDMMLVGAKPAEEALKLKSMPQFNAYSVASDRVPTETATVAQQSYSPPGDRSDINNSSQSPAYPTRTSKPSIHSYKDSQLNHAQSKSKLDNAAPSNHKPVEKQVEPTKSSFNLKLLLIASVIVGVLGMGFLYYHTMHRQNNSSVESPV